MQFSKKKFLASYLSVSSPCGGVNCHDTSIDDFKN